MLVVGEKERTGYPNVAVKPKLFTADVAEDTEVCEAQRLKTSPGIDP